MSDKELAVGPRFFLAKNRIVKYLKYKEAYDKTTAQSLTDLNVMNKKRIINILVDERVITQTTENHFFVRFEALDAFEIQRKKFLFVLITSIVIPAVLFLLLGIAWIFTT